MLGKGGKNPECGKLARGHIFQLLCVTICQTVLAVMVLLSLLLETSNISFFFFDVKIGVFTA